MCLIVYTPGGIIVTIGTPFAICMNITVWGPYFVIHNINNLIIKKTLELGGTISGEHGIGLGHKDLFETEHGGAVELMRKIKLQFDPHGILNPGKIFEL